MANISQIKLPNGDTHNFIDTASGYTKNTGTITSVKTTAGTHSAINVTSGAANFNVPTKTSHLTNDSGFVTTDQKVKQSATTTTSWRKVLLHYSTNDKGDAVPTATNQVYAAIGVEVNPSTGTLAVASLNSSGLIGGGSLNITGSATFGDTVSIDDLNAGQLVVSGSASFANTINGNIATASALKDSNNGNSITACYSTGGVTDPSYYCAWDGYKITYISKANLKSAINTNTTYSAGTGLSLSSTTFSVKLGYTTSGNNRAVQADSSGNLYVTQKDDNSGGTVTKVTAGTGLSIGTTAGGNFTTTGTINHTNSVTAQTTQAVYPIKIDAQGHISAYGSAQTILSIGTGASNAAAGNHTHSYLPLSGGTLTGRLTTEDPINQIITGSGTAASDKGSGVSPRYFPAKWTFNTGQTATNGDIITIEIPVAGHSYGVFLSIDNGSHYHPVVVGNGTGRITTHYGKSTPIQLIFDSGGSAADMYALNGANTRATVTGGVWRVLNFYTDGNTYTQAYCTTAAATAAKAASMSGYVATAKRYVMVNITNTNTSATALTLNINSTGAKPVYINGSASSTSNHTLPAGSYLVYYNGTNYYFRIDDYITGNITGHASGDLALTGGTISGDLVVTKSLKINNHSSAIGTVKTAYLASNTAVPRATSYRLLSLSLEAGTWIVYGFPRSEAKGSRGGALTPSDSNEFKCLGNSGTENTTWSFSDVFTLTSTTTIYLEVLHNEDTSITFYRGTSDSSTYMKAVRIA